jgi:alginate O-acetyltransferase complex protein AlgI
MLFPSTEFAIFFAVTWAVAWLLREANTARKTFLTLASLMFYAAWDARFVLLLMGAALLMLACGQLIERCGIEGRSPRLRAFVTGSGIMVLLAVLGYFKYADLLIASLMQLADLVHIQLDLALVEVAVPVAISFFTFHAISYLVDVYKGVIAPSRSLLDLTLYISFFPHLVAGPIVRAREFLPQLSTAPQQMPIGLGASLVLIMGGLFKKVVIANYLSTTLVDPVYVDPQSASLQEIWGAFYGYALVIYCDFSAYTDIAIGVASLFGYRFPQNFDQPYRALSVQEFWNRWHITLSHWLRDYLYIPLGGNRLGRWFTVRNLMITMLLGGSWHGASGTFVLWGGLHGLALMIHYGWAQTSWARQWRDHPNYQTAAWFLTFHTVCLLWILFRAPDLETASAFFNGLIHAPIAAAGLSTALQGLLLLGALTHVIPSWQWTRWAAVFEHRPVLVQSLTVTLLLLGLLLLAPGSAAPFIYFRF